MTNSLFKIDLKPKTIIKSKTMEYYPNHVENTSDFNTGILEYRDSGYFINDSLVVNNRGLHGDLVYYDAIRKNVTGISKRKLSKIVGVLRLDDNKRYGFNKKNVPYVKFTSVSGKYPDFIVPCKLRSKVAQYAVISLNRWNTSDKHPVGQIEEYLGDVSDELSTIRMVFAKVGIRRGGKKVGYHPFEFLSNKKIDYSTFSIDPLGCRDIDDAFHFTRHENGNVEIGIHIANVARQTTFMDIHQYSSIYYRNGRQDNMLEDRYSFDNFSLVDGQKRLALSLIIKVKGGTIVSREFRESIVKNTALSYDEANEMNGMNGSKCRQSRELLEFSREYYNEPEMTAQNMVERFMILYNTSVAEKLFKCNPMETILRTHQGSIVGEQQETTSDAQLFSFLKRRQMEAAVYAVAPEDTRHKTLGLEFYTHATSPIRRYVDIINQHMIIASINPDYSWSRDSFKVDIDAINSFNKSLRKFYNHYKKLEIIHSGRLEEHRDFNAYIVGIKGVKLTIWIPALEITHKMNIVSPKLLVAGDIKFNSTGSCVTVNERSYNMYDSIRVIITPRPSECVFNRKLHVSILEFE